jgi:tripartite ATP-independent transporter DctM subunit
MSIELITLLMFGAVVLLLISGLPIGFATGGVAVLFTVFLWGPESLYVIANRSFSWMTNTSMVAIPMFVFMAGMLSQAGVVDDLFDAVYIWAGPLRGGLAIITILVSTVMAAMTGIVGATEVTMGLVALPAMLKRNYDKGLALGCIAAGGSLGYLIPPSIVFILFGVAAEESVGKLFMGGIVPGLLLSGLYILYIGIRSYMQPHIAPALPKEERQMPLMEKLSMMRLLFLPLLLIFAVLGSIYMGVATITEASGVGAFGAVVITLIHGKFTWHGFKESSFSTIRVSSMIMWLVIGSSFFISVYTGVGGTEFAKNVIGGLPLGRWGILIVMQLFLLFLGCFIDWVGILTLTIPIFLPIIKALGFDPLWYGVLFNINMQVSLISPPFGPALFYLRGIVPPGITIRDIYKGCWPYIIIQCFALALCMIFPQIILWLPSLVR